MGTGWTSTSTVWPYLFIITLVANVLLASNSTALNSVQSEPQVGYACWSFLHYVRSFQKYLSCSVKLALRCIDLLSSGQSTCLCYHSAIESVQKVDENCCQNLTTLWKVNHYARICRSETNITCVLVSPPMDLRFHQMLSFPWLENVSQKITVRRFYYLMPNYLSYQKFSSYPAF